MTQTKHEEVDVLLVGAGIMSATLGTLLKELDPEMRLELVELMDSGAAESSNPWNNAGTGHAGLCELNYTPEAEDGSIDINKAASINSMFEVSKQFWSHLVEQGTFSEPQVFINPVPHLSFVRGNEGVAYLKKRFAALTKHHCFEAMEFAEDTTTMTKWIPLMMPGRDSAEPIAATRVENGTDVNFGALTGQLLRFLASRPNAHISYDSRVTDLERPKNRDGWLVELKNEKTGKTRTIKAKFVFLGAGGAALPLLQKSDIDEGKGYGGFPVSGQWLRCDNPEVVAQHTAKVYSQAEVGAPPMSVPHLDTRIVGEQKALLFGPFAGFSTKFLRHGSYLDLPKSIRPNNIGAMLAVARDNMDLTKYLMREVMQSMDKRMGALRKFYPNAKAGDWRLETAGQRVQIIKTCAEDGGKLEFGTEIVAAKDGSLAALLGASPGASVSVSAMLDLLNRCFAKQLQTEDWSERLKTMIPASAEELQSNAELYRATQTRSNAILNLVKTS